MIRKANLNDLESIMNITKEIVKEMKSAGNPQWHDNYPTKEDFTIDINNNTLYVYEEERVVGFICIAKDIENDYEKVLESSKEEAYIVHRLGIDKNFRKSGIATKLMSFAEELATKNNIYLIKADTEVNNQKMNALFKKLGYHQISTLTWSDNDGLYNYYEKKLNNERS